MATKLHQSFLCDFNAIQYKQSRMIHIFEIPVEEPKKEGTETPVPQARPSRSKKMQYNTVENVVN